MDMFGIIYYLLLFFILFLLLIFLMLFIIRFRSAYSKEKKQPARVAYQELYDDDDFPDDDVLITDKSNLSEIRGSVRFNRGYYLDERLFNEYKQKILDQKLP